MANILEMLGIPSPTPAAPLPADLMPGYAAPPQNVLQTVQDSVAPPMPQPMQAPPMSQPAPIPQATPADAGTRPARTRSSILDTIGRVSDVLAKVGGAPALYQPTLDARQDRVLSLGDHDRQVDLDKLKAATERQGLEAGQGALTDANRARVVQAMKYLNAIKNSNPNADVSQAWPILAQQAGIPAEQMNALGQAITANPDIIAGMAEGNDTDKYGGSVVYGTDASGKLVAYQPGLGAKGGRNVLPEGVTPIDPQKAIDLGGGVALMGTRTGTIAPKILPKTEAPGKALDRTTRVDIAKGNNATTIKAAEIGAGSRITVAGMPARVKPADAKAGGASDAKEALIGLDQIQRGFDELHNMKALPGDGGSTAGNVLSALGRTGLGQKIGEQTGSAAAQKRLELGKNINTLQQTLIKALPASATRTKFEQEILRASLPDPSKMSYGTARTVIGQYKDIFRRAQAAAVAEQRRPAAAPVKPNSGASAGWKLVGVNK